MLGQSSATPPHELVELAERIRDLLSATDAYRLDFVGVHLCEALEALQRELRVRGLVDG